MRCRSPQRVCLPASGCRVHMNLTPTQHELGADGNSVCVIAGDISPIDVISPLPVLCEERGIPYVYVPSKEVRCHAPCLSGPH